MFAYTFDPPNFSLDTPFKILSEKLLVFF